MARKTGVWLDTKKAIIVDLQNEDKTFKVIDSGIEGRERQDGEKKKFGRFANQFLSFEKRKQRKSKDLEKHYFKNILKAVSDSEELVLFGPSTTKLRLQKEIVEDKSFKTTLLGVEDADSMTDNQVKAWVVDYFKKP